MGNTGEAEMKYCSDCKHYIPGSGGFSHPRYARCARTKIETSLDMVSPQEVMHRYCESEREEGVWPFNIFSEGCGKKGKYWEKA